MSKYLKLFDTTAEYNAYTADTANFIKPNVSLITETNTVEYNPIIPPYSGFCKLYLNDGSTVELEGSGTLALTYEQKEQYYETCVGIEIGTQCTAIGDEAFRDVDYYFDKLASVTIPNSVTSIGDYAFGDCTGLTSIDIPSGVTRIDSNAFRTCGGLTTCTIGNGVTIIGSEAFESCRSLTSITINATTPPTLDGLNEFSNTNNCPIYVPSGSVTAYKAAEYWSDYASRIQPIA